MKTRTTKLKNFTVYYHNSQEFHQLKREIWGGHLYYKEFDTPTPTIIDAGAHIGLSTLYFKSLYPHAHIIAIEPHPTLFQLLKKNIFENQIQNVHLHNIALDKQEADRQFFIDTSHHEWWSTAGFYQGGWTTDQVTEPIRVSTQTLSSFLTEHVDLLKLDIEGAEMPVLQESYTKLHLVDHIFVEFHPVEGYQLSDLTDMLQTSGFRITLWKKGKKVNFKHAKGLILVEGEREE